MKPANSLDYWSDIGLQLKHTLKRFQKSISGKIFKLFVCFKHFCLFDFYPFNILQRKVANQ